MTAPITCAAQTAIDEAADKIAANWPTLTELQRADIARILAPLNAAQTTKQPLRRAASELSSAESKRRQRKSDDARRVTSAVAAA